MTVKPKNILLVRLSSAGDVVLASPAARWLRRRYPGAHLCWLVDAGYEDLVRRNPCLDRTAVFDYTGRHRGPSGIRRLAGELGPVDLLVDLQHKLRTSLLHTWLRPDRRLVLVKRRGMDLVRAMMGRDTILRGPHQIQRYLSVLGERLQGQDEFVPELAAEPELVERAREQATREAGGRPLVGLVPGARHLTKVWPFEHLRSLAERCLQEGLAVALLGGHDDALLVDDLRRSLTSGPVLIRAGAGLDELAAQMAACALVVGPDSGPAHMAAALGVPVVALFGPTSPERWAPVGRRVAVVRLELACSPCSNHGGSTCPVGTFECMRRLEPGTVWEAVANLLADAGREAG